MIFVYIWNHSNLVMSIQTFVATVAFWKSTSTKLRRQKSRNSSASRWKPFHKSTLRERWDIKKFCTSYLKSAFINSANALKLSVLFLSPLFDWNRPTSLILCQNYPLWLQVLRMIWGQCTKDTGTSCPDLATSDPTFYALEWWQGFWL